MASTGRRQWMAAAARRSTAEGEDNGGGRRVRRLGQRMSSPLQTACEHGGVDLGKGDDSPCWLSTLSCSPAPYIAAAASSRPLSFPTPTLFSASASIPAPTTTSISSLARITGREGSGGEGGEEAAARLPHLCSLPAPAVLLLLPSRSTELPDTNTVDAAINPLSCCSRRSAKFSLLLLLSPSQSTSSIKREEGGAEELTHVPKISFYFYLGLFLF